MDGEEAVTEDFAGGHEMAKIGSGEAGFTSIALAIIVERAEVPFELRVSEVDARIKNIVIPAKAGIYQ